MQYNRGNRRAKPRYCRGSSKEKRTAGKYGSGRSGHTKCYYCAYVQGIIFGYATDETESMLPLTIHLAHKVSRALDQARHDGTLPWLSPCSKTMVVADYRENAENHLYPVRIRAVVLHVYHSEAIASVDALSQIEKLVKGELTGPLLDDDTKFLVSGESRHLSQMGLGHPGITGRRIMVDTYGGWGGHGGGAFSGKVGLVSFEGS